MKSSGFTSSDKSIVQAEERSRVKVDSFRIQYSIVVQHANSNGCDVNRRKRTEQTITLRVFTLYYSNTAF